METFEIVPQKNSRVFLFIIFCLKSSFQNDSFIQCHPETILWIVSANDRAQIHSTILFLWPFGLWMESLILHTSSSKLMNEDMGIQCHQ